MLTNQAVAEDLIRQFGENVYDFDEPYGLLTLSVRREQILPLMLFLKEHISSKAYILTDITGVHYPDEPGREFCVVYHVHSLVENVRIRLKVFLAEDDLHLPSMTVLYASANWMERETFDFFGIQFDGHPNLMRILNMEEMDYYPMRKQYPLEDGTREDKIDALFGR